MSITRRQLLLRSSALPLASLGLAGCATVDKPSVQARLQGRGQLMLEDVDSRDEALALEDVEREEKMVDDDEQRQWTTTMICLRAKPQTYCFTIWYC